MNRLGLRELRGNVAFLLSVLAAMTIGLDVNAARVYVVNGSFTGDLVRVEGSSGQIVGTPLRVGAYPRAVAVSPTGDHVYVVNSLSSSNPETTGSVSVISVSDWRVVSTVPMGSQAAGAALTPNGERLFVASSRSGIVSAVDTGTLAVRSVPVGTRPVGVAIDPSGSLVYVGTTEGVRVISAQSVAPLYTISLQATGDSGAEFVAVSPDGRFLYVTELIGSVIRGNLVVIDADARTVVARIPLADVPRGLALSRGGERLYVGLRGAIAVFSTQERRVVESVPLSAMTNGLALTIDDRELWVMLDGARLVAIDTETLTITKSVSGLTGAHSMGGFIGPRSAPQGTAPVVEYYHAGLDHYFSTQDAGEIAALDRGTLAGWARTGQSFFAYPPHAGSEAQPVCRYYGLPAAGLNSHFYSASGAECAAVATQFPGAWMLEASNVFAIDVPSAAGACPAGTEPVYRLWNGRADSNHRYTMHSGIRAAMLANGYVSEGYGALGVAMCGRQAQ